MPRGLAAVVETDKNGVRLAVGRDDLHPYVIVTNNRDVQCVRRNKGG